MADERIRTQTRFWEDRVDGSPDFLDGGESSCLDELRNVFDH